MTTHPVTSAPNESLVAPALEAAEIGDLRADFRGSLFLAGDPWCWDKVPSESSAIIRLGSSDDFAHCELLDRATVDTVAHRGRILVTHASTAPGGGDAAALFRY